MSSELFRGGCHGYYAAVEVLLGGGCEFGSRGDHVSWSVLFDPRGGSIRVPSRASLSASPLHLTPLCPLAQIILVVLLWHLTHAVMLLRRSGCFENIHPWSSHFSRFLVSPKIANIESFRGIIETFILKVDWRKQVRRGYVTIRRTRELLREGKGACADEPRLWQ